jgi:hypothetical protein
VKTAITRKKLLQRNISPRWQEIGFQFNSLADAALALAVRLPDAQESAFDRGRNGEQAAVVAVSGDQHDAGRNCIAGMGSEIAVRSKWLAICGLRRRRPFRPLAKAPRRP